MEDTFGKVVAILICAVQMFLIPLYLYMENTERMEQTYILSEITYYVDNFRNTGIISDEQYNNMRNGIFSLSGDYDIIIVHCTNTPGVEDGGGMYFNTMAYEGEIEKALERDGVYYLSKNDYLNVYVEDKKGDIKYTYGGAVKNEAY